MALPRNPKEVTAHEMGLPSVEYTDDGQTKQFFIVLPLGADWEAHVRLEPEDGHPVVAELRVVPWVHWRDDEPATTPPGGLRARQLRKLNLGAAVDAAYEELSFHFRRGADPDLTVGRHIHRFSEKAVAEPRHPGRRGRDDSFYATLAADYADKCKGGSRRPVKDLAKALGDTYTDTYVRDLLSEARRRGLLTRPQRGFAGGELTEKGRKALEGDKK
jgi:hypothetical protein